MKFPQWPQSAVIAGLCAQVTLAFVSHVETPGASDGSETSIC